MIFSNIDMKINIKNSKGMNLLNIIRSLRETQVFKSNIFELDAELSNQFLPGINFYENIRLFLFKYGCTFEQVGATVLIRRDLSLN